MANQNHQVDSLATGTATVIISDDGTGIDWLSIYGLYSQPTEINLNWTYTGNASSGTPTSASGFYYTIGSTPTTFIGHRLIVNGQIESAVGSVGRDSIQGNSLANTIYGDNTATGIGGNDTLFGGEGNDSIVGGSGNDEINGAEHNDYLMGNAGNDTISGGGGHDTIEGGAGADSLSGGANGHDLVDYHSSNGRVIIKLTFGDTTTGQGGHAAGDRINGFNDVSGSHYDDIIIDTVQGTTYNANTFYGNAGNDRLTLGGNKDVGYGDDGDDTLNGGAGNDTLSGGRGHDVLIGGTGVDSFAGDLGADAFVFSRLNHSGKTATTRDRIIDFRHAQGDEIDLSGIDAKSATTSVNEAFKFIGTNAFHKKAGELQLFDTGPSMLVRGDVNGDGQADFTILVMNVAKLVVGDFIL